MDENEVVLEIFGGSRKKRLLLLFKELKVKKLCWLMDFDSEESDEVSIVCQFCNKKILKELYRQYVDEELELRKRMKRSVFCKVEGVLVYIGIILYKEFKIMQ